MLLIFFHCSCLAHYKDLDGGGAARSHDHTRVLMQALEPKELWDSYGIIDDVLVSRWSTVAPSKVLTTL